MKNTTKYLPLHLILSITFFTSSYVCTMEPLGEPDVSNEVVKVATLQDQKILTIQINTLRALQKQLKDKLYEDLPSTQRSNIQKIQQSLQKLIEKANNMYFGVISVNILSIERQLIYQKIDVENALSKKYW